uniref:Uncharacterized protein n=1 Tax=Romanomermis culicivorax TaxID=13658 RepID=A0A915JEH6_ROMCU
MAAITLSGNLTSWISMQIVREAKWLGSWQQASWQHSTEVGDGYTAMVVMVICSGGSWGQWRVNIDKGVGEEFSAMENWMDTVITQNIIP